MDSPASLDGAFHFMLQASSGDCEGLFESARGNAGEVVVGRVVMAGILALLLARQQIDR
jgi:hypothetical protein